MKSVNMELGLDDITMFVCSFFFLKAINYSAILLFSDCSFSEK